MIKVKNLRQNMTSEDTGFIRSPQSQKLTTLTNSDIVSICIKLKLN